MPRPAPDPYAAEAAVKILASGRPAREAADVLGVRPNHVRRSIGRALDTREQHARAELDRVRTLRAELAGGENAC